jgi:hypothetical protein
VEHAAPLLMFGMVIVPVTPLGTALTPGDAPVAKPFVPTGALGSVPSEEVTPSDGVTVPTWANAGLQDNKGQAAATINNGLIEHSPVTAEGLSNQRPHAVGEAAEAMTFFFMAVDRG